MQATDWQTVVSRRGSQKPPKDGGWNLFFTNVIAADLMNPIVNLQINGKGKKGGWFGWPEIRRSRTLRDAYAALLRGRTEQVATEIQTEAYDQVIYIPLGHYRVALLAESLPGVLRRPGHAGVLEFDKSE